MIAILPTVSKRCLRQAIRESSRTCWIIRISKTRLGVDYFSVRDDFKNPEAIVFTGPIDSFFTDDSMERLEYRSLRFEYVTKEVAYFQKCAQVNYPGDEPYTRITEPKHATGQMCQRTTIIYEYPSGEGEPYYPIPNQKNQEAYEKFKRRADIEEGRGLFFVGRLANYKYFNMDQAFSNALAHCIRIEGYLAK